MIKYSQSTQSNKFTKSLQYLNKEVRNGVHFLHADKHQSFYKFGLLFLMQVARYVQSTQNTNLEIFLQYIKKRVSQLLLYSVVMQKIQIFYQGPVMFIASLLFTARLYDFLPKHWNTIIKQQLCEKELPSLLPLLQIDVFQEKQGILWQINLFLSKTSQKKLVSGLVIQIIPPKVWTYTNVPPYGNWRSLSATRCEN